MLHILCLVGNHEDYLQEFLYSISRLSPEMFHVHIIENGSNDSSRDILRNGITEITAGLVTLVERDTWSNPTPVIQAYVRDLSCGEKDLVTFISPRYRPSPESLWYLEHDLRSGYKCLFFTDLCFAMSKGVLDEFGHHIDYEILDSNYRFKRTLFQDKIFKWPETKFCGYYIFRETSLTAKKSVAKVDDDSSFLIESGNKFSARYVFFVGYRNQRNKISRCLESIFSQDSSIDFGIVLLDDFSDDYSLQVALPLLESFSSRTGKPHIAVRNFENKRYARSLYNAVHHIFSGEETVIIEVDGDDYLFDSTVLSKIDSEYANNPKLMKTFGGYTVIPTGVDRYLDLWSADPMAVPRDSSNPYDYYMCLSWLHLKTSRLKVLRKVELAYFLEREDGGWIQGGDDAAIQPRAFEIASELGDIRYLRDRLYVHDLGSGSHTFKASYPYGRAKHEYMYYNLHRVPLGSWLKTRWDSF